MTDSWREDVLKHVPHGEEGTIDLDWEDAFTWAKILNRKGYAVLLTGGEFEGEVTVRWIYAGSNDNLDWADYGQVCFTHAEYIESYPEASNEECDDELQLHDSVETSGAE